MVVGHWSHYPVLLGLALPHGVGDVTSAVTREGTLHVGVETVMEGRSPSHPFSTVFEDDGDTGYFYALDLGGNGNPIVDAMQIYNVASAVDKERPSRLQISWSSDGRKSALLINGYIHALFDFAARRGYCRTNFPAPNHAWTEFDHRWSDEALDLLR
jgi:hypothetical protein